MWLVLCDPADAAALWAFAGLRARGLAPLELVSPRALVCALRTVHRVDRRGACFDIALADGRTLDSRNLDGVLNRLAVVPVDHLRVAPDSEARYAGEEVSALVLSWLACIAPVCLNRTTPRGLAGALRAPSEWTIMAAHAGLATPPVRLSSRAAAFPALPSSARRSVIVLGAHVFGHAVPPPVGKACGALARMADTDLLGIELDVAPDGAHRFAGATPLPDLRIGGSPLLDALHRHLANGHGARAPTRSP
jgi:hypothetical protein